MSEIEWHEVEIFEAERAALVGDRGAVVKLVSLERSLRLVIEKLMDARYRDGFVDTHFIVADCEAAIKPFLEEESGNSDI